MDLEKDHVAMIVALINMLQRSNASVIALTNGLTSRMAYADMVNGYTDKVIVERGRDWKNKKECLVFAGMNNEGTAIWEKII